MRSGSIFLLIGMMVSVSYPSSSYACRVGLPGAGSKTNQVNFSYFDHVVLMLATADEYMRSGVEDRFSHSEYTKVQIIKSYKGKLPGEFFTARSSSAVCGYDFQEGQLYLAFFDARKTALGLEIDPNMPFFMTTLSNFTTSRLILVDSLSMADKIIEGAR